MFLLRLKAERIWRRSGSGLVICKEHQKHFDFQDQGLRRGTRTFEVLSWRYRMSDGEGEMSVLCSLIFLVYREEEISWWLEEEILLAA